MDQGVINNLVSKIEKKVNKVTSWSNTPTDDNYPSEKLVKDSLDGKASTDSVNSLSSGLSSNLSTIYSFIYNLTTDKVYDNGNLTNIGTTPHSTQELVNSSIDSQLGTIDSQLDSINSQLGTTPFFIINNVALNGKRRTYQIDLTFSQFQEFDSCYIKVPTYETSTNYYTYLKFSNNTEIPFTENSAQLRENEINGYLLKVQYSNNGIVVMNKWLFNKDKLIPSFVDLSELIDEKGVDLSELELIDSTNSLASASNWTGTSTRLTSLTKGTRILYRITYVPTATSQGAGLSIQFTNNTHSGYRRIIFADGTEYNSKWFISSIAKNDVLLLEYDGTNWVLLDFFAIGERPKVARTGSYNDLSDKPTIPTVPTNISSFNNDSGYLTAHQDISGKEDKLNKVTSLSSSSTDIEYPSAKAVFDSLPSVPNASSVTPNADTTSGSVGDGTTWARSNHTHPKSSLYAEASHTHSQYLTSHQDITGKEDKSNKITSLNEMLTESDTDYPSSLLVLNHLDTKEDISNKVTSMTAISTDDEYPSAKCVYDKIEEKIDDVFGYIPQDLGAMAYEDNVDGYVGATALSNDYEDLDNKPTIPTVPTNISSFNNDSGYLTAHQDITGKEDKSNKVTSLSSSSTDTEYPSAKCVHDELESLFENTIDELIEYGESL